MGLKLGFITPTYNRPDLFERLHRSLLPGEDRVDWCHYAVNDGSDVDYSEAFARCSNLSGRLAVDHIKNSGPLVARNRAIRMALADGCTHFCFIDDDNELIPQSRSHVSNRIEEFSNFDWFVFRCIRSSGNDISWPAEPIIASWFDDIVQKRTFGSDNPVVVSARLVGNTRFTKRGRNQREWTFFLELSKKRDDVLVCPDPLIMESYQIGGLSDIAMKKSSSFNQVCNNIERAILYWSNRPFSLQLFGNALLQIATAPIKILLGLKRRVI